MKDPKKTKGAERDTTKKPVVKAMREAAKESGIQLPDPPKAKIFDINDHPMFKHTLEEYAKACHLEDGELQIGVIDMRHLGESVAASTRRISSWRYNGVIWDDDVERIYQEWRTRHPNFVEEAVDDHMKQLAAGPTSDLDFRFMLAEVNVPNESAAWSAAKSFCPEKHLRGAIRETAMKVLKKRECYRGINFKWKTQAIVCDPLKDNLEKMSDLLSRSRFKIVLVVVFDDFEDDDNVTIDTRLVTSFKLNTETVEGFRRSDRSHELSCIDIYHELCPKQCRCDNVFEAIYDKEFEEILHTYCTALSEVPYIISMSSAEAGFLFIDFENITISSVAKMISDGYLDNIFADDELEDFDKPYIIFSDTSRLRYRIDGKIKPKHLMSIADGLEFVIDQAGKDAVYVKIATEVDDARSDLYLFNCRASAEDIIKAGKEIDAERKERFGISAEDIANSRSRTDNLEY